ncbi:MAG TPA: hypothetical protein VF316_14275 [Polyangiaceae bacterium]
MSKELTAALQEARLRRAALEVVVPVAGVLDAVEAIPAAPDAEAETIEAEVVKMEGEGEP